MLAPWAMCSHSCALLHSYPHTHVSCKHMHGYMPHQPCVHVPVPYFTLRITCMQSCLMHTCVSHWPVPTCMFSPHKHACIHLYMCDHASAHMCSHLPTCSPTLPSYTHVLTHTCMITLMLTCTHTHPYMLTQPLFVDAHSCSGQHMHPH